MNLPYKARLSLLEEAGKYQFSMGLGDASSQLSQANMRFGLSKIHHAQEELGMEEKAIFIGAPDECVTKNVRRWQNGFGYGGKLIWGNGKEKLIFLDVLPNACGILVGSLDSMPDCDEVVERARSLMATKHFIDDVKVNMDINRSNHFIDVFKVVESDMKMPPYVCLVHSGTPELRGDNGDHMGMYFHQSKMIQERMEAITTQFGSINYVQEGDAREYLDAFDFANDFSKKKRLLFAGELFDDFKFISNHCHQGLPSYNEMLLGVNSTTPKGRFPLALRANARGYMLSAAPNLSEEMMEKLNFKQRAEQTGAYDKLVKANILPHGGGYTFPMMESLVDMKMGKGGPLYGVKTTGKEAVIYLSGPTQFPFTYRGGEVLDRILELELGRVSVVLEPVWVLNC